MNGFICKKILHHPMFNRAAEWHGMQTLCCGIGSSNWGQFSSYGTESLQFDFAVFMI
jgi:hypothetical protein